MECLAIIPIYNYMMCHNMHKNLIYNQLNIRLQNLLYRHSSYHQSYRTARQDRHCDIQKNDRENNFRYLTKPQFYQRRGWFVRIV